MTTIDKIKSGKKTPYSNKAQKECVKITEEERNNLKSMIRERERERSESKDYYYFLFFFILLLIIATIVLIAI
jgi:hypothetical protein